MATAEELWNTLQEAGERYLEAVEATSAFLRDPPGDLLQVDRALRMAKAIRIQNAAHERYSDALQKYNEAVEHSRNAHLKL